MINWRTIVGALLLVFGVRQIYNIMANPAGVQAQTNLTYAAAGCAIWIVVGVYLMIKGMSKKSNSDL